MKTLKLRIRDKHCKMLDQLASEVNFVWNYVNDLGFKHLKRKGEFLSAYDVAKYTKGASKECNLHSQTIQAVTEELVTRRKQFKKAKLKWRVSNKKSARRSLGWIPFKKVAIKSADGSVQYGKHQFKLWDSYGLSQYRIKTGSFVEDSRGRWYVCLVVDSPKQAKPTVTKAIGIDLGLKDIATCSDGTVISNPKFYRKYEQKLGIAQRARNKKRVRALHAKIANCRKDHLHKASTQLVRENALIVVGDLSAKKLVKTKMAKSVLDTGFSKLKTMLKYKCENAGVMFEEVNEAYTTQICSCCKQISSSSPQGRVDLGIREWTCQSCGTVWQRDLNSALNILALGHKRLAVGISFF
ncbi:transposase [Acinetobacter variabilis]|mgnify:CR=1 FL=1|uniref:IS200/IS605 family element transposase accessory protein TnpB n=1 Tax=Acinetobacter variabilis TaxID=70346 RepID=A0A7T8AS35_9GAMM|nr:MULTISPECIES: RNA-guided endonuclease TnpB family protein [Acinetobacter]NHB64248.1 IS200/IS605 family element transposase accessory protein TnpB [Acinetobacter sp. GFQ9D191M]NHB98974.1 IS200/IS605 family element transposase accessory protein TnpB [Acinetobacter sp. GFQ9D192M]QQN89683.1 IS200/IS605 family element transposase accessory protein TnpB [Acinetobacter variabilis]UNW07057.1 transposase [Acinetobacter variabilis]WPC36310.1 transposase [Acinetobacter sp. YWS30-1]